MATQNIPKMLTSYSQIIYSGNVSKIFTNENLRFFLPILLKFLYGNVLYKFPTKYYPNFFFLIFQKIFPKNVYKIFTKTYGYIGNILPSLTIIH